MTTTTRTIKLRLRDKHAKELCRQARAVNFVWNYCNETQRHSVRRYRCGENTRFLSHFDLGKLTAGTSTDLALSSTTIKAVCKQYAQSRSQHKKPWLRWRGKKSLGWVPYEGRVIRFDGTHFVFRKIKYQPFHLRDELTPETKLRDGSFSQDRRGRWYINCVIEIPAAAIVAPDVAVGIDLGLKDLATLSTGEKVANHRRYRQLEAQLAVAQRARKKKRVRAIHARIANGRKDDLHKASLEIAKKYRTIFVGDVSSSKLARTKLAKSVLDAGWYDFKQMLSYKALMYGGRVIEVDERYTSRGCSGCGALSGPKGPKDLGVREWTCSECGETHDRDVNAARNILRVGQDTLEGGVPSALEAVNRSEGS